MACHFQDYFWEGNGFEELHRHMKNGTDFCKEFESVLSDRADVENTYVKGLHKIVKKAKQSSKRCVSTMEPAWTNFVALLETEEEAHRTLAAALSTECAKILKAFTEQQIKQREPLESAVDKQHKHHMEKQSKQMKNKRAAFKTCRDLEGSWDQLRDVKGGRSGTDKEVLKLEKSCRKLEEALMKADREYKDSNLKTEQSRLGWEAAVYQCCKNNEILEQERLQQVQTLLCQYSELLEASMPPIQTASQELTDTAGQISPEADLEYACTTLGTGPNQPEQLLLDCYEEEMRNTMDPDRRQASLERKIQYIEQEIERQQKTRAGVEQLAKAYQEQPDFVDEKGADDVNRQLIEADSILNLLKANHYKLLSAHADISNAPRPSSQFGDYIVTTTDKHGQTISTLKIPLDQLGYIQDDYQPSGYDRKSTKSKRSSSKDSPKLPSNGGYGGGAEGYNEEDEVQVEAGFSEDFGDTEYPDQDNGGEFVGECRVLYEYQANESDELNIVPGDVIKIIDKYDTEWWQGELNGTVGIFPASYVEDV